jgi:dipeptidyl aminopeptidase/acylaminoacyl peptidase
MSDERLEQAIAHWGDRFTGAGVEPADFRQVTSSIDNWGQWCEAWSGMAGAHEELGRRALAEGRSRSAGDHLAQAATYYHFAQFVFLDDLTQAEAAQERATCCLDDALAHLVPPGRKESVAFEGTAMVGILRLPARGDVPFPTVLLIPGLDSTKAEFRRVEQSFLDRGVATFSLDGPGQGESRAEMPMRADWEAPGGAALDHLAQLPEVDGERLGVWGVSLGGYYAPRLASADSRVKACISLAGPYTFGEKNWHELPDLTRAAVRRFSRSSSDDEARRFALTLSLEGRAGQITCPLLVVFGKKDRLIPWADACRLAEEASGPVELLLFDEGNHGCTNILYRHRPYGADWMAAQLSATR